MRILKICGIVALTVLIGCANSEAPNLAKPSPPATTGETAAPTVPSPHFTTQLETPGPAITGVSKVKLINDLNYTGKEISLNLGGRQVPATFVEINLHPYGFYIPENMQEFVFEDGSEVGLNRAEFIGLSEVERLVNPDNLHESLRFGGDTLFYDEELQQFEEYIGSSKDGDEGPRVDGFLLKHGGTPDMLIYFRYFNKNKESVLPIFLEVTKNIKYIEP
ncbi:hypothetical protein [Paenibacillus tepidiphilus]|uniref:hypothetical protein n=1 Tax=Paenibacillus tepidiphilus TaxID=2608683 RepID=UPI00123B1476|nr:hypothetical protein [Paenibacillus tepidiphilus]